MNSLALTALFAALLFLHVRLSRRQSELRAIVETLRGESAAAGAELESLKQHCADDRVDEVSMIRTLQENVDREHAAVEDLRQQSCSRWDGFHRDMTSAVAESVAGEIGSQVGEIEKLADAVAELHKSARLDLDNLRQSVERILASRNPDTTGHKHYRLREPMDSLQDAVETLFRQKFPATSGEKLARRISDGVHREIQSIVTNLEKLAKEILDA